MIYATGHSSGAHCNPAVTLAFATTECLPVSAVYTIRRFFLALVEREYRKTTPDAVNGQHREIPIARQRAAQGWRGTEPARGRADESHCLGARFP